MLFRSLPCVLPTESGRGAAPAQSTRKGAASDSQRRPRLAAPPHHSRKSACRLPASSLSWRAGRTLMSPHTC